VSSLERVKPKRAKCFVRVLIGFYEATALRLVKGLEAGLWHFGVRVIARRQRALRRCSDLS